MEQTFLMIKPDGVQRMLAGEIIKRLEGKGFRPVAVKMMQMSREMGEKHYAEHRGKPFFPDLVAFISSGPVLAMVWEGENIIRQCRTLMGSTDPGEAAPGTIRGDLGQTMSRNIIHGSDSPTAAAREIALFFQPEEILAYSRDIDKWM